MKLLRKDNVREGFSKLLLVIATAILCLWMVSGARAASLQITDIKSTTAPGGDEHVQILFSGKLSEDQVVAEFQRNFLQLSVRGASAVPAKNSTFKGQDVDKVFIYQYQPDLARARILFKKDASSLKDRVEWKAKDNAIEINITGITKGTVIKSPVAKAVIKLAPKVVPQKIAKIQTDKISVVASSESRVEKQNDPLVHEDERLIKEILKDPNAPLAPAAAKALPVAEGENQALFANHPESNKELGKSAASAKADSPIRRMVTGLLTVLIIMAAMAYGFKRFVLQGRLGLSRQGRMIDMVSSYMLSPKKSITVVRVGRQFMVLGVTDNQINLIQNLGDDPSLEKYMDDVPSGASSAMGFESILSKKVSQGEGRIADELIEEQAKPSIRSLIKQRIEGFKPL